MEEILGSIVSDITTKAELDRLQRFIEENGMDSNEELNEKIKNARSSLRWTDKYGFVIKNAIRRNIKNKNLSF